MPDLRTIYEDELVPAFLFFDPTCLAPNFGAFLKTSIESSVHDGFRNKYLHGVSFLKRFNFVNLIKQCFRLDLFIKVPLLTKIIAKVY